MSAAVEIPQSTELNRLDELVGRLREGAKTWARLPLAEKLGVARRMRDEEDRVLNAQPLVG